jgi:hypothetical protein
MMAYEDAAGMLAMTEADDAMSSGRLTIDASKVHIVATIYDKPYGSTHELVKIWAQAKLMQMGFTGDMGEVDPEQGHREYAVLTGQTD